MNLGVSTCGPKYHKRFLRGSAPPLVRQPARSRIADAISCALDRFGMFCSNARRDRNRREAGARRHAHRRAEPSSASARTVLIESLKAKIAALSATKTGWQGLQNLSEPRSKTA
jgi:hypothetical protein